MKRGLSGVLVVTVMCAVALVSIGYAAAEENAQQVMQDLTSGVGLSQEANNYLVNGPGDTFGARLETMLNNGTITQGQYNSVVNRFSALPDEKRWALKGAYDQGKGASNVIHKTAQIANWDDTSLRDHVKDLRDKGFTKDQIVKRLRNEGVPSDHLKDLVYGPAESSRPQHIKDLRDSGSEHATELGHQKYQNRKVEPSRPARAKDRRDAR